MSNPQERYRSIMAKSGGEPRSWFRVENKAENDTVRVDIYDVIDPFWGVGAKDFVKALNAIDAKTIDLHINSPGGDVYDAVAIYHALKDHKATVNCTVDGIAASAASFITQSADYVEMNTYAEMMIHNPSTIAWGDAAEMRATADFLDRNTDKIVAIYAERSGNDSEDIRAAMDEETWYSAQEAVDAGLADGVKKAKKKDDKADNAKNVENTFDLSAFNYAGRSVAPAPQLVNKNRNTSQNSATLRSNLDSNATEVSPVTPDQLEELGLQEGATDEEVLDAIKALKTETPETPDPETETPAAPVTPEQPATPKEGTEEETSETQNSVQLPKGLTAVDTAAFAAMQARFAEIEADNAAMKKREHETARDSVIQNALQKGKIAPASAATYASMYDLNAASAEQILKDLPENVFPTTEIGHSAAPTDSAASADEYPDEWKNGLVTPGSVF